MKKQKIISAALAISMATTAIASCSNTDTMSTTVETKETTNVVETTLSETEEVTTASEAEETGVEIIETEPEETEPEIDLTLYQEGSYYDLTNHPEMSYKYDRCREIVQMINDEHPDETMYYGLYFDGDIIYIFFCNQGWGTESFVDGVDPWDWYLWNSETDELTYVDGDDRGEVPYVSYTYEDFMRYPVLFRDYESGNKGPMNWEDSIPDGEYYARIKAISLDGTKMLVVVKDLIVLSADEYYNLKPGDVVSIPYDDPRYGFDLTVSSKFDPADSDSIFDSCGLHFEEREDGSFVLTDNHNKPDFTTSYNARLMVLDIAPDCEIDDTDYDGVVGDFTPFGFKDAPNSLTKSYFFYYVTGKGTTENIYNDWIPIHGNARTMFVENNTIVKMYVDGRLTY